MVSGHPFSIFKHFFYKTTNHIWGVDVLFLFVTSVFICRESFSDLNHFTFKSSIIYVWWTYMFYKSFFFANIEYWLDKRTVNWQLKSPVLFSGSMSHIVDYYILCEPCSLVSGGRKSVLFEGKKQKNKIVLWWNECHQLVVYPVEKTKQICQIVSHKVDSGRK